MPPLLVGQAQRKKNHLLQVPERIHYYFFYWWFHHHRHYRYDWTAPTNAVAAALDDFVGKAKRLFTVQSLISGRKNKKKKKNMGKACDEKKKKHTCELT